MEHIKDIIARRVKKILKKGPRCAGCGKPGDFLGSFCSGCLGNNNRRHTGILLEGYRD